MNERASNRVGLRSTYSRALSSHNIGLAYQSEFLSICVFYTGLRYSWWLRT